MVAHRAWEASSTTPRVQVLKKSGPHAISKYPHNYINLYFHVKGLKYGAKYGPGAKPKAGQGHIEIYMDSIPRDAYHKVDVRHAFNYHIQSLRQVTIEPNNPWINLYQGKHTLLIVLAKNNDVLYPIRPVKFSLNVK